MVGPARTTLSVASNYALKISVLDRLLFSANHENFMVRASLFNSHIQRRRQNPLETIPKYKNFIAVRIPLLRGEGMFISTERLNPALL